VPFRQTPFLALATRELNDFIQNYAASRHGPAENQGICTIRLARELEQSHVWHLLTSTNSGPLNRGVETCCGWAEEGDDTKVPAWAFWISHLWIMSMSLWRIESVLSYTLATGRENIHGLFGTLGPRNKQVVPSWNKLVVAVKPILDGVTQTITLSLITTCKSRTMAATFRRLIPPPLVGHDLFVFYSCYTSQMQVC
jgi:hypothetical protein